MYISHLYFILKRMKKTIKWYRISKQDYKKLTMIIVLHIAIFKIVARMPDLACKTDQII